MPLGPGVGLSGWYGPRSRIAAVCRPIRCERARGVVDGLPKREVLT